MTRAVWVLLGNLVAGCAHPALPSCDPGAGAGPIAWVVDGGWHTDVGLPADELTGQLAVFRTLFPGARALMFGFGKRSFITVRSPGIGDYLSGSIPGPAAIRVTALPVPPGAAYTGQVILLSLPPGGVERLSSFLWNSLAASGADTPTVVHDGLSPGSAFYAASHGYNLGYTCNTWTVSALAQAGLPVNEDVILASGALRQIARIKGACRTAG